MSLILTSILLAIVGGVLFSLIGFVSGSDETATMVPFRLPLSYCFIRNHQRRSRPWRIFYRKAVIFRRRSADGAILCPAPWHFRLRDRSRHHVAFISSQADPVGNDGKCFGGRF